MRTHTAGYAFGFISWLRTPSIHSTSRPVYEPPSAMASCLSDRSENPIAKIFSNCWPLVPLDGYYTGRHTPSVLFLILISEASSCSWWLPLPSFPDLAPGGLHVLVLSEPTSPALGHDNHAIRYITKTAAAATFALKVRMITPSTYYDVGSREAAMVGIGRLNRSPAEGRSRV